MQIITKRSQVLFTLVSVLLVPIETLASCSVSDWGKVTNINVGGGFVFVSFNQTIINPDNCSQDNVFMLEKSGNIHFDEVYSAVLHAQALDADTRFCVSGCSGPGPGLDRPHISSIHVDSAD